MARDDILTAALALLDEGEGTDIPRRGAAPTPAKRWGEARIRAALAQVE